MTTPEQQTAMTGEEAHAFWHYRRGGQIPALAWSKFAPSDKEDWNVLAAEISRRTIASMAIAPVAPPGHHWFLVGGKWTLFRGEDGLPVDPQPLAIAGKKWADVSPLWCPIGTYAPPKMGVLPVLIACWDENVDVTRNYYVAYLSGGKWWLDYPMGMEVPYKPTHFMTLVAP